MCRSQPKSPETETTEAASPELCRKSGGTSVALRTILSSPVSLSRHRIVGLSLFVLDFDILSLTPPTCVGQVLPVDEVIAHRVAPDQAKGPLTALRQVLVKPGSTWQKGQIK